MAVQCAECGEELLGAVNRCWRCGKEFVSTAETGGLPPLRRSPPRDPPLLAEVVDVAPPEVGLDSPKSQRWQRRGSPFASAVDRNGPSQLPDRNEIAGARQAEYPPGAGAGGGAIAAILLAGCALASDLFFPLGGLILAAAGIGLGVWGLNSPRRRIAIAGIIVCCFTFTLSVALIAYRIYEGRGI